MIDKYTKAVLTVIAVSLCLITAQNFNFVTSAEAGGHPVNVRICDMTGECAVVMDGRLLVGQK